MLYDGKPKDSIVPTATFKKTVASHHKQQSSPSLGYPQQHSECNIDNRTSLANPSSRTRTYNTFSTSSTSNTGTSRAELAYILYKENTSTRTPRETCLVLPAARSDPSPALSAGSQQSVPPFAAGIEGADYFTTPVHPETEASIRDKFAQEDYNELEVRYGSMAR